MIRETLLIEDNSHKRSKITEFIHSLCLPISLDDARSFSSGCKKFESRNYEIILADISLPTYDKADIESGGKFRPFAGREIARKISRLNLSCTIIFITQYKAFSDRGMSYSFDDLKEILKTECAGRFGGMVYYDPSQYGWKEQLKIALEAVTK